MKNQKDIKRKIKAVASIQKVTKAMETMANIKLQKASKAAVSAREYFFELYSFVNQSVNALTSQQLCSLSLCRKNETKNVLFVVFTSDKGLCGSLNGKMLHKFMEILKEETSHGRNVKVIAVGKKGIDFLRRRKVELISSYTGASGKQKKEIASKIIKDCTEAFISEKIDAVYLYYNHYISTSKSEINALNILPLPFEVEKPYEHIPMIILPVFEEVYPETKFALPVFTFEPEPMIFVKELFVKYLEVMVIQIMLESEASENAARMIAMQQATTNASEMIDNLNIVYNKARQSQITGEIIEVVSSAEALR